jgi:serine phosphatase RsbU (regulator of sigma subunit)
MWFGTWGGGLSKYAGQSFTHYTDKEGLSSNGILSILQDKKGNTWFGTNGNGVFKYDGKQFTHFTIKQGLANEFVACMLEDIHGNIWFGTKGDGICKYDGHSFTAFIGKDELPTNDIRCMLEDKKGNIWIGTSGGGVAKYDGTYFYYFSDKEGLSNNVVRCMLEDNNGNIWIGTNGGGVFSYNGNHFMHYTDKEGLSNDNVWSMLMDKSGNIWLGTFGGGVSKYDGRCFTHFTEEQGLSNNFVFSIWEDHRRNLWFGTRFGLSKLSKEKLTELSESIKSKRIAETAVFFKNYNYEDGFWGIGVNSGKTIVEDENGNLWIGTNDRLTAFHASAELADTIPPNIQVAGIELFNEPIPWEKLAHNKDTSIILGNGVKIGDLALDSVSKWYGLPEGLSLAYDNNNLTFNFIGITQKQSKRVKYQYKLEGMDPHWSALTSRAEAPYGNLPHGTYTFKVKAMNSEGHWSKEFNYTFSIRPPWWKTWWFQLFVALIIITSVILYIKSREWKLRKEKAILEHMVVERTTEVVNEKKIVEEQKQVIEEKHKEITDSINYAERIQRAFLATRQLLDDNLKQYFVFFQPKEVVSGDFYWAAKLKNNHFLLVTADSTGHGVPGAIMSILNISCLEKSVEEERLTEPAAILDHTRLKIMERLKKDGSPEGGKDGMDGSVVSFDFEHNQLRYAAANNPVWIVRKEQLLELSADKMPVGKHDKDNIPFTQHRVDLQKGDVVYTFTDGMADQFGGPKGKKLMYKPLKAFLQSIAHLPMPDQQRAIGSYWREWKGDLEQVDDICIIGVRI